MEGNFYGWKDSIVDISNQGVHIILHKDQIRQGALLQIYKQNPWNESSVYQIARQTNINKYRVYTHWILKVRFQKSEKIMCILFPKLLK